MEKVGFIGACDKQNIIIYVAKILQIIGKKVIVVDTTMLQKMKYIVPAIKPAKSYITDFEDIDFAVGFKSITEIAGYLKTKSIDLPYDYMLIDIDHNKALEYFQIENTKNNYFVTSFDTFSLMRGAEILKNITEPMNLSKILYDYSIRKADEDYLNYLTMDTKVEWNEFNLYVPTFGADKKIIEDNQKIHTIRLKKLNPQYIEGLIYITQDIIQDLSASKIKKMIKE